MSQLVYLAPAALAAVAVVLLDTRLAQAGWLLSATSIMTGLTFSMTTTFWGKSIEARRNPNWATNTQILATLDDNRNHLMWTVLVGIIATGVLAVAAIFVDPVKGSPIWLTAICAGLVLYLIALVAGALQRFAEAALLLR